MSSSGSSSGAGRGATPSDRRRRRARFVLVHDEDANNILVETASLSYRRMDHSAQWAVDVDIVLPAGCDEDDDGTIVGTPPPGGPLRRLFQRRAAGRPVQRPTVTVPAAAAQAWADVQEVPARLVRLSKCPAPARAAAAILEVAPHLICILKDVPPAARATHPALSHLLMMAAEVDALARVMETRDLCSGAEPCVETMTLNEAPEVAFRRRPGDDLLLGLMDKLRRASERLSAAS